MKHQAFKLTTILSHPFEQNTYIAALEGHKECVVVDPGLEPNKIIRYLEKNYLTPAAILITHGHSDHIAGNGALKKRWPACTIVVGVADAEKLTDPRKNLSAAFGAALISPPADITVEDGELYEAAGMTFKVLTIPGHSVGHVVFVYEGQNPPVVFVGDVIFAGSIGRTDFPDGSHRNLVQGIRAKLFSLPDDTVLLPGHGEPTTVDQEKRTNPFL